MNGGYRILSLGTICTYSRKKKVSGIYNLINNSKKPILLKDIILEYKVDDDYLTKNIGEGYITFTKTIESNVLNGNTLFSDDGSEGETRLIQICIDSSDYVYYKICSVFYVAEE